MVTLDSTTRVQLLQRIAAKLADRGLTLPAQKLLPLKLLTIAGDRHIACTGNELVYTVQTRRAGECDSHRFALTDENELVEKVLRDCKGQVS